MNDASARVQLFSFLFSLAVIFSALLAISLVFSVRLLEIHRQQLGWDTAALITDTLSSNRTASKPIGQWLEELAAAFPGIGIYVVDSDHEIVLAAHKVFPGKRVNVEQLRRALVDRAPTLPLKGEDPRRDGELAVFSTAPLRLGRESGYLYLTLSSPFLDRISSSAGLLPLASSLFLILLPGFCFSVIILLLLLFSIRIRLQHIAKLLDRELESPSETPIFGWWKDEVSILCKEVLQAAQQTRAYTIQLETLREKRHAVLLELLHDLRAPIVGLAAGGEILRREWNELSEDEFNSLDNAFQAGFETQSGFLSMLHRAELLQHTHPEIQEAPVCWASLLSRVVAMSAPRAVAKNIQLESECADTLPAILGDEKWLERALANLVENAIQYTPSGGRIRADILARGSGVEIRVSDTGAGIAPAELPLVFKPFFRGESTTPLHQSGAGLGLAIVQKVVELHGSSISVESIQGKGTTFSFLLTPRQETASPEAMAAPSFFSRFSKRLKQISAATGMRSLIGVLFLATVPDPLISRWSLTLGGTLFCLLAVHTLRPFPVLLRPSNLLLLWWIVALISYPVDSGQGMLFNLFWFPFGLQLSAYDARSRVLAFVAALWLLWSINHPEIPAVSLVAGMIVGAASRSFSQSDRRFGLLTRLLGVSWVLGMPILGWEVYALQNYWTQLAMEAWPSGIGRITSPPLVPLAASLSRFSMDGAISQLLLRKASQVYLIYFAVMMILAGLIASALLVHLLAPTLQRTIEQLRTGVRALHAGSMSEASLLPALSSFCERAAKIRENAARDDQRTKGVILGLVRELSIFSNEKLLLYQEIREARALNSTSRPRALNALNALLQVETRIIGLLFQRMQQRSTPVDFAPDLADLSELIDDLRIQLAAFAHHRKVSFEQNITRKALLKISSEQLQNALFALLCEIIARTSQNSRLEFFANDTDADGAHLLNIRWIQTELGARAGPDALPLCSQLLAAELFSDLGITTQHETTATGCTWTLNFEKLQSPRSLHTAAGA